MNALGPCGLARLPEELVDMVCSFIVSFTNVKDLVTTLCSLALTSRKFLEPARRGLLYDPTRILATRSAEDAHTLLNRVIQQPSLGAQVQRLEGFVDMFDNVELLSLSWEVPAAFMNWAVHLMRLCPNTTAVSLWPDPSAGWLAALALLPRLRHVMVAVRDIEWFMEDDMPNFTLFLDALPVARLQSLALRGYCGPMSFFPRVFHVATQHLELDRYGADWFDLRLALDRVQHLTLRPEACALDPGTELPPALKSFILRPHLTQAQLNRHDRYFLCRWEHLFASPRRFNNLRIIVLQDVVMHPDTFADLCTSSPNLERLELPNNVWHAHWDSDELDVRLVDAIAGLRRLRVLHLGQLPNPPCSILDTRVYCRLFDIELEWRGVEVEWVEAARAAPLSSEFGEGGPERSTDEDEAMSGGSFDGSGARDGSSAENEYEVWRLVRSAELDFDLSSASSSCSSAVSPSFSLTRPPTPSSSNATSLFDTTSHACLPPRLSPSPTPPLDDGTLSGVVFARTAAAEQRYVFERPSVPHLEDGYQATDDGVDEDLEDEPSFEADECDVDEADRGWREYDDEGEDECVARLWLVEGEWHRGLGEEEALGSEP
ncbi:hypothetical protein JCM8208_004821 [Rhodotorula glutinis]